MTPSLTGPSRDPLPWPWRYWQAPREVRGRELRYLLTSILMAAERPMTVPELVEACCDIGVEFSARPSKVVSDALRWEISWRRVKRLRRGVYCFRRAPRSTKKWILARVAYLKSALADIRDHGILPAAPPLAPTFRYVPAQPCHGPPR